MRRNRIAVAVIGFGLAAGAAWAQSLPPGLLERAQALPAPTGAELQRHAAMLETMTAAQREAFRQRVAQWDALVPARQRERREVWQAWLALPIQERQQLQAAATAYAALPVDRQQALRTQYDTLDGSDKRGWLLGPVLGADYSKLHALVAQVPAPQRDALLAALRGLSPEGRADLSVLAQRTPPQGRDALRTQLLAVPAPRRDAWLRERVQQ